MLAHYPYLGKPKPLNMEKFYHYTGYARFSLLLAFLLLGLYSQAQEVFVVNSTADHPDVDLMDNVCADLNGDCTLRAAIENANKSSQIDVISFSINGDGPFTIGLSQDLPAIIETVVLDASTQENYTWFTPQIFIDGANSAQHGFRLEANSSGSTIRGFSMGNFNKKNEDVIQDNGAAIYAHLTNGHRIAGNYLGVAPDGETAVSNVFGLSLIESSNNLIGGVDPADRNLVSGNYLEEFWGIGIYIHGQVSTNNYIKGNLIGTTSQGTSALPNHWGVVIDEGANQTTIGGASAEERNIISGNIYTGVYILGAQNLITGNYIGIGIHGEKLEDLKDSKQEGVRLWGEAATENIIGGLGEGEGNVISGNINFNAITIGGESPEVQSGNKIYGNKIGTDASGTKAIPNYRGITVSHSRGILIEKNLISSNITFGLSVHNCQETQIFGNKIGVGEDGITPLGNGDGGIKIVNGSESTKVGDIDKGNIIAYNAAGGVIISYYDNIGSQITTQPLHNSVLGNQIFENSGLGIDLGNLGITANDRGDSDFGANQLQNYPVISEGAKLASGNLDLNYILNSDPAYSAFPLTLHYYKSDGNGQGVEYLGSSLFTQNDIPKGKKTIPVSLLISSDSTLQPGDYLLATATDANGNTSEFSAQVQISGDCVAQTWYVDLDEDGFGVDAADTNISSCTKPEGSYVTRAGDCDDSDKTVNPLAEDIPDDGIDQDCDGEDATTAIVDTDGDGVEDARDNCVDVANPDQADTNGNGIGDACEDTTCLGSDILDVTNCTSGNLVYWTVVNPGSCAVDVRWEIRKGSESGTFILEAGESNNFTTALASKGQTQIIISWNDSNGAETKMSLNASGASCTTAAAFSSNLNEGEQTSEPIQEPVVYPNPIAEDGFYIRFAESLGGRNYHAAIYDFTGRLIQENFFDVPLGGADLMWHMDTSAWDSGIYILQLQSGGQSYQINLAKE